MEGPVERLAAIKKRIGLAAERAGRDPSAVKLVAVSKTFDIDDIRPVLQAGQRCFGENRVQEAKSKWPLLKQEFPDIELHLIGPLQSNKSAEAVALFDVIQSVDRPKIANLLAEEMQKQGRKLSCLVQVNTGDERQKAGVGHFEAEQFIADCRKLLPVQGLMCIPPVNDSAAKHFKLLAETAKSAMLSELSMGMSSDFETAIAEGATIVRVGSAIFGSRSAEH